MPIPVEQFMQLMKKTSLFASLDDDAILKLLSHFEPLNLKKDQVLIKQGDVPDYLYLLISGKLQTSVHSSTAGIKILGEINPVETVGELGALTGELRSSSVKALEDSVLLQLPGEIFFDLCRENPFISFEMLKTISHRAVKTIELIAPKHLKCAVFFAANPDARWLALAFKRILKNFSERFSLYFVEEDTDIEKIILQLGNLDTKKTQAIIFVNSYSPRLFEYFHNNETSYFLLGMGSVEDVDLDNQCLQILESIKKVPDNNLELILLHPDNTLRPSYTQLWLDKIKPSLHHHIKLNNPDDYARVLRFITGNATGLVLGGGGFKCMAHFGAMKALQENNFIIDYIGGVSSGAFVGAQMILINDYDKRVLDAKETIKIQKKIASMRNFTIPLVSIFSGHQLMDGLNDYFGKIRIEDLWRPFFCVAANISTNTEVIFNQGLLSNALRCSGSYPVAFPPMVIGGQLHIDGGILNNLPIDIMRKRLHSKGKIIASHISHYRDDQTIYDFPPGIPFRQAFLYKMGWKFKEYKMPSFLDVVAKSLSMGATYKEEVNSLDADILIQPNLAKYGAFSVKLSELDLLVDIGYRAAQEKLKKD